MVLKSMFRATRKYAFAPLPFKFLASQPKLALAKAAPAAPCAELEAALTAMAALPAINADLFKKLRLAVSFN
jgi:hypothetical protein